MLGGGEVNYIYIYIYIFLNASCIFLPPLLRMPKKLSDIRYTTNFIL